jgi:hypothetical protein
VLPFQAVKQLIWLDYRVPLLGTLMGPASISVFQLETNVDGNEITIRLAIDFDSAEYHE